MENNNRSEHSRERERESKSEELTIEELRDKLVRKELEAKLKERNIDSTLRGVCQTCHTKIHLDEVFYTPSDYASETQYSGQAGGGGVGGTGSYGAGGAGGVAWQGKGNQHDVREDWIQCGFCYTEYFKDKKDYEGHLKRWNTFGVVSCFLVGGLIMAIAYFVNKEYFIKFWLCWLISGLLVGLILGGIVHWLIYGSKPEEPNRYKPRVMERKKYDNQR